jgi:hypothetical protein
LLGKEFKHIRNGWSAKGSLRGNILVSCILKEEFKEIACLGIDGREISVASLRWKYEKLSVMLDCGWVDGGVAEASSRSHYAPQFTLINFLAIE